MKEFSEIEELVLTYFKIDKHELYSKSRKRRCVEPRMAMMYILRNKLRYTYQELGRLFNCHHATAIHHVRTMDHMKDIGSVKTKYDVIMDRLSVKPVKLTDNDALKRIMEAIVWEEKGTTRKNLEKLLETNMKL